MTIEKILIFGGKGGVGKSSIATATAAWLAREQPEKKVLLMSFDVAHNVSDILNVPVGSDLTAVSKNLYAMEPNPDQFAQKYAKDLQTKMQKFVECSVFVNKLEGLKTFFLKTFDPDNLPLGQKNALFFNQLLEDEDALGLSFDYVVADFPPTGNMMALFEAPMEADQQFLRFALEAFQSIHHKFVKIESFYRILHPISSRRVEDNSDELTYEIFDLMDQTNERTAKTAQLLKKVGSLRLVSIAEKASIEEAKRAYDLANPYVPVHGLHVNRTIPANLEGKIGFLDTAIARERRYVQQAQDHFGPKGVEVVRSELLEDEPVGLEGALRLAEEVYGDKTAMEVLSPSATPINTTQSALGPSKVRADRTPSPPAPTSGGSSP